MIQRGFFTHTVWFLTHKPSPDVINPVRIFKQGRLMVPFGQVQAFGDRSKYCFDEAVISLKERFFAKGQLIR